MEKHWFDDWNITESFDRISVDLPHSFATTKNVDFYLPLECRKEIKFLVSVLDSALTELTNKSKEKIQKGAF